MFGILISLCLFSLFLHSGEHLITYTLEAEPDLEMNPETSLEVSIANFLAKGGTLVHLDDNAKPYAFQPGDAVFPACSAANNRSQTLWALLQPYAGKILLMKPHATRYGFDPYNGQENWQRTKHFYADDEFAAWSGFKKSMKFGFDKFDGWLAKKDITKHELATLSKYYDEEYFRSKLPQDAKRVYVAFAKNAHVHLYRLAQTNESLKNVIVVSVPLEDLIYHVVPEWNTDRRSKQAYANFADILIKYFDFSAL